MVDDYHRNTGEGADLDSAGRTRGCGGSGLWRDKAVQLNHLSPDTDAGQRTDPRDVRVDVGAVGRGGGMVRETRRVDTRCRSSSEPIEQSFTRRLRPERRWPSASRTTPARPPRVDGEHSACCGRGSRCSRKGSSAAPDCRHRHVDRPAERGRNYLLVAKMPAPGPAVYCAGSTSDKAGEITTARPGATSRARPPVCEHAGDDTLGGCAHPIGHHRTSHLASSHPRTI